MNRSEVVVCHGNNFTSEQAALKRLGIRTINEARGHEIKLIRAKLYLIRRGIYATMFNSKIDLKSDIDWPCHRTGAASKSTIMSNIDAFLSKEMENGCNA